MSASALRKLVEEGTGVGLILPATVVWFWGPHEHRGLEIDRFDADARLIALAPELATLAADMADWIYWAQCDRCPECLAPGDLPHQDNCTVAALLARLSRLVDEGNDT